MNYLSRIFERKTDSPRKEIFSFRYEDVHALLEKEAYYPNEVKERVAQVIMEQRRKYSYLFG